LEFDARLYIKSLTLNDIRAGSGQGNPSAVNAMFSSFDPWCSKLFAALNSALRLATRKRSCWETPLATSANAKAATSFQTSSLERGLSGDMLPPLAFS
jgi:hypothetical protein